MNMTEYEKVKNFTYLEYCDYLQQKYGIGLCDYMTKSWNKNRKVTRTKDGLYVHHKYEDHAIRLSEPKLAINHPFEWQKKENLVYCDLLEHLLLHLLILKYPSKDRKQGEVVGLGGIVEYIVPELNDVYSGWTSKQPWQQNCHNAIINDKDVYFALLKRYKEHYDCNPFMMRHLYKSYNKQFGLWSNEKNEKLYEEIEEL